MVRSSSACSDGVMGCDESSVGVVSSSFMLDVSPVLGLDGASMSSSSLEE